MSARSASKRMLGEVEVTNRGRHNRRYRKGPVSVRLWPDRVGRRDGDRRITIQRVTDEGATFELFLNDEEAETVADALDDLLDYLERSGS